MIGGDTDSFILSVENGNDQLLPRMLADNYLDTSNYTPDHPLYTLKNKASLRCMKDEAEGVPINAVVMLRPKCYALSFEEQLKAEKKRAKGVQRAVLQKDIVFDDYKNVWLNETKVRLPQGRFASNKHIISTKYTSKLSLSIWEDKRAWVDNNTSLPYGNYKLEQRILPKVTHRLLNYLIESREELKRPSEEVLPSSSGVMCDKNTDCENENDSFIDDKDAPTFIPGKEFKKRRRGVQKYFDLEARESDR